MQEIKVGQRWASNRHIGRVWEVIAVNVTEWPLTKSRRVVLRQVLRDGNVSDAPIVLNNGQSLVEYCRLIADNAVAFDDPLPPCAVGISGQYELLGLGCVLTVERRFIWPHCDLIKTSERWVIVHNFDNYFKVLV